MSNPSTSNGRVTDTLTADPATILCTATRLAASHRGEFSISGIPFPSREQQPIHPLIQKEVIPPVNVKRKVWQRSCSFVSALGAIMRLAQLHPRNIDSNIGHDEYNEAEVDDVP